MIDALLHGLETAIEKQADERVLRDLCQEILKQLRGKGPAPSWNNYPKARTFFTQRYP